MSRFFRPYEGARAFLFISYAHRQSDAVVDTIRILHEKKYRLWYDEGIPAGSDWPANIAQHMQSCERVVFFLSARAMESPNCYSEIRTAARLGKPVLVVRLEDVDVEPRWRELLDDRQFIPLLNTPEERAEAILKSGFVPRRFRVSWVEKIPWRALGLAASLLFFLAAAGVLGALAAGRLDPGYRPDVVTETPAPTAEPTPVPTVDIGEAEKYFAISFPDTQQERAIRQALDLGPDENVYRWQLAEIKELYFCGNMFIRGLHVVSFDPDGTCRVNMAPVIEGRVSDMSLLRYAVGLEKLALIKQPMADFSGLRQLTMLQELSLACSPISDVGQLGDMPSLNTLHLEHTAVRDLTALDGMPRLQTVTVSRDMLPLRWSGDAAFTVILTPDQ
ncbi:MAG: TIR domain-containing protein [Oscillospiraceae bacterium]|nr:TIR domain-containing protein [Oscillospiraceae bacterium]